jgi:COMPASS component SWD3
VISGSEDGNVYIWDREVSASAQVPTASGPGQEVSPMLGPSSANVSRKSSLRTAPSTNRASPAYYPPRANKQAQPVHGGAGMNVRPTKVLAGHGDGAVFDARWRDGRIVSAGEDGVVGVWCEGDDEAD